MKWREISQAVLTRDADRLLSRIGPDYDFDALEDEVSGMLPGPGWQHYLESLRKEAWRDVESAQRAAFQAKAHKWLHKERVAKYGGLDRLNESEWQAVQCAFGWMCVYCGKERELTIDHIEPLSRGGDHAIWNVAPACQPCNSSKHTDDIEDWCKRTRRPLEEIEARLAKGRAKLHSVVKERPMAPPVDVAT